jgi:sarcosine oxidase
MAADTQAVRSHARPRRTADVIVVGLGAMGSATVHQLAQRGARVIGIDRHHPPHPYGSTHGDTRITRLSVGEGAEYVALVARSHELWRELEAASDTQLLTQCGGLILGRSGSPFVTVTADLADRFAIAHEILDAGEIRARFPAFAVDDDTTGYYEPTAGHVRPEAAVAAQLGLARDHDAQLQLGETVTSWAATDRGVTVTTDRGRYAAAHLVLSPGAWLPEQFPEGRDRFAVYRQLLHWFEIRGGHDALRELPVFVWDLDGGSTGFVHLDCAYGFPALDGPGGGVKVATERYDCPAHPDGRQHPATPEETAQVYEQFVRARLPALGPHAIRTASCLYTCTDGARFVIDCHPDHATVTIVSACSGHGFKHSPAIGEAIARRLTGEPSHPSVDLRPFALEHARRRPAPSA